MSSLKSSLSNSFRNFSHCAFIEFTETRKNEIVISFAFLKNIKKIKYKLQSPEPNGQDFSEVHTYVIFQCKTNLYITFIIYVLCTYR